MVIQNNVEDRGMTAIQVERAQCDMLSGPAGTRCPRNADGVWVLAPDRDDSKIIPLCRPCMDDLQEQFDEAHSNPSASVFRTFSEI